MSTRCNVVLKDQYDKLIFYRHSDGYPSSVIPSLTVFMNWVKTGAIRSNVEQCAGWLIALGMREYDTRYDYSGKEGKEIKKDDLCDPVSCQDWKVGAYEPCSDIHGDIEYLYTIDLQKLTIRIQTPIKKSYKITGYNDYVVDPSHYTEQKYADKEDYPPVISFSPDTRQRIGGEVI